MYFHVTVLTVECRLLRVFNTLRNIIHLKSVTSPQLSATTPTLPSHRLLGSRFCFVFFRQGKYSFPSIYTFPKPHIYQAFLKKNSMENNFIGCKVVLIASNKRRKIKSNGSGKCKKEKSLTFILLSSSLSAASFLSGEALRRALRGKDFPGGASGKDPAANAGD